MSSRMMDEISEKEFYTYVQIKLPLIFVAELEHSTALEGVGIDTSPL